MDNLLEPYIIIGLFVIIIVEAGFTYLLLEREKSEKDRLLDEIAKANTALAAKSAQEYVMMRSMDNVVREEPKREETAKDMSELTDEEYDQAIAEQLK